jgi:prepilin-type N-terminal cleavage/methylation domain-containing protein
MAVVGRLLTSVKLGISHGFTLIEVMIAVVVLSVAFLATASTVIAVISGNNLSKQMDAATMLAQDKLEELRNLAYSDPTLNDLQHQDPNSPLTSTGAAGGYYMRTWNITTDSPSAGMKTVSVTVQWTTNGKAHSVVLRTIKAAL